MVGKIEKLRERREAYVVMLQEIIKLFARDKARYFMFFEGKDADYFRPRILTVFYETKTIKLLNCQGKKNLKPLYKSIKANASLQGIFAAFFFDRDYELNLSEITADDIFVTDGYAIENYYTSANVVESALRSMVFSDISNEEDEEKWLIDHRSFYEEMRGQYDEAMLLFNSWARAQRVIEENGKIDLNVFKIDRNLLIDFGTKKIAINYDLVTLNNLTPERRAVLNREVDREAAWFLTRNRGRHFRGKQDADFLYLFLTFVIENVNSGVKTFLKRTKVTKRVSRKDIIFDLSNYAETSSLLVEFLLRRKSSWTRAFPRPVESSLERTADPNPS